MRIVNDDGITRTTDEAAVCEPTPPPDGEAADDQRSDSAMDREHWTPEEEGYGFGV